MLRPTLKGTALHWQWAVHMKTSDCSLIRCLCFSSFRRPSRQRRARASCYIALERLYSLGGKVQLLMRTSYALYKPSDHCHHLVVLLKEVFGTDFCFRGSLPLTNECGDERAERKPVIGVLFVHVATLWWPVSFRAIRTLFKPQRPLSLRSSFLLSSSPPPTFQTPCYFTSPLFPPTCDARRTNTASHTIAKSAREMERTIVVSPEKLN